MDKGKRHSTTSEESRTKERQRKSSVSQERCKNGRESFQGRGKANKPSLIPVPKFEKTEPKSLHQKQRKYSSSTKLSCMTSRTNGRCQDLQAKLKLLEEKEKSIAQYYLKVEDLIEKLTKTERNESNRERARKPLGRTEARKMTSEPSVFTTDKKNIDILSDLENSVRQITKIWQETSTDLSSTLRYLKNNPSLDPMDLEMQNVKIQLAIKQTKSLTLVKTRDVLAEARKLFRHREMIRTELENIIKYEKLKEEPCTCCKGEVNLEEKDTNTSLECESKQKISETGDSPKESDPKESELDSEVNTSSQESTEKERDEASGVEECVLKGKKTEDSCTEEKEKCSGVVLRESRKPGKTRRSPPQMTPDVETLTKEMSKKNETIANLNNKLFELQKTCNEQSHKCEQLQLSLCEMNEKTQWNHVLRKQIVKLKDQIKGLQQSNKHLESQKRELECKITKMDQELDRLNKLNHFLNQRKFLMGTQDECQRECRRGQESNRGKNEKCDKEAIKSREERILAEKQNAINQLKTILNVMRDQENFAQNQITVFQNTIEELEKNTKS